MPTDSQIAIMCDVGERQHLAASKQADAEQLVAEGFLERDPEYGFKLSARGAQFLSERGAGLNEA